MASFIGKHLLTPVAGEVMVFTVERISHDGALVLAPPALKLLGSILCPLEHLVQLRHPGIFDLLGI